MRRRRTSGCSSSSRQSSARTASRWSRSKVRAERIFLLLLILILSLSSGCTADFRDVSLPDLGEGVSTVLIALDGDDLELRAFDAGAAPRQIAIGRDVDRVIVLHVPASLEELGISAGELALAITGDCASIPLPEWSAAFSGDDSGELAPITDVGSALRAARIRLPCPCVKFEQIAFDLEQELEVRFAIPYDDRRMLLVSDLALLLVDAQANLERI